MASNEWAREHRELQFLRAASPEGRGSRAKRRRRRLYADVRWRKLQAINPRFRRKQRPGQPTHRQVEDREMG